MHVLWPCRGRGVSMSISFRRSVKAYRKVGQVCHFFNEVVTFYTGFFIRSERFTFSDVAHQFQLFGFDFPMIPLLTTTFWASCC